MERKSRLDLLCPISKNARRKSRNKVIKWLEQSEYELLYSYDSLAFLISDDECDTKPNQVANLGPELETNETDKPKVSVTKELNLAIVESKRQQLETFNQNKDNSDVKDAILEELSFLF